MSPMTSASSAWSAEISAADMVPVLDDDAPPLDEETLGSGIDAGDGLGTETSGAGG
jgi:hypothetical protein